MTIQQHLKVRPTSRGIRIWLEGKRLTDAGFNQGDRYQREHSDGQIIIALSPNGRYKVSGKPTGPIIDISAKELPGFPAGKDITATFTAGRVVIA